MVANLTVVVPFYNGHDTLFRLVDSIAPEIPIIVVDDVSEQPLQRLPWMGANVTVIRMRSKGYFAGAVNAGIEACKTDVLVLNQDIWFDDDRWVGLVDDHRNEGFAMIGERIHGEHPAFPRGYIHGTFMFLRRDAIKAVGPLNGRDYPLWGNTAEWQWRAARKHFRILPLAEIPGLHHQRQPATRFGYSITGLLEKEPEKKSLLIRTPPLVSVIVPCHNYGRYLKDCIASLIGGPTSLGLHPGQTMQSLEVIIVDDASTDETPEIGAGLEDAWKGIRYYRLDTNVGTARTLNYGIERASGQYITFLSADDMREADSIEKLVRACEENPHHFAYDDVQMFGSGKRLRTWRMQEYDFELLLSKNHVHAGILYPRVAWVEAGGYPAAMNDGREDWAFNIALGQTGWCGAHVRHYGYLYRREGQNRSLTNTTTEHRERFLEKIRGIFPRLYEGVRPMACCGGKKTSQNKAANRVGRQAAPQSLVGAQGMTRLEYSGAQQESVWTGHVTNTAYRFGAGKRVGWVDNRDVGERPRDGRQGSGFLSSRKNGNWLFGPYVESVVPAVSTPPTDEVVDEAEEVTLTDADPTLGETPEESLTPEPVAETAEAALGVASTGVDPALGDASEQSPASEPVAEVPDPNKLTIAEIKALELTPEQWNALRDLEIAGDSRKGVLEHVEKLLAP